VYRRLPGGRRILDGFRDVVFFFFFIAFSACWGGEEDAFLFHRQGSLLFNSQYARVVAICFVAIWLLPIQSNSGDHIRINMDSSMANNIGTE
jgi:hypothetical protein